MTFMNSNCFWQYLFSSSSQSAFLYLHSAINFAYRSVGGGVNHFPPKQGNIQDTMDVSNLVLMFISAWKNKQLEVCARISFANLRIYRIKLICLCRCGGKCSYDVETYIWKWQVLEEHNNGYVDWSHLQKISMESLDWKEKTTTKRERTFKVSRRLKGSAINSWVVPVAAPISDVTVYHRTLLHHRSKAGGAEC